MLPWIAYRERTLISRVRGTEAHNSTTCSRQTENLMKVRQ